jgi:hypothetical protein
MEHGCWSRFDLQPRPVRVIALSGVSETEDQRIAQAPFARKLLKPVDPWELCREILEVVRP